MGTLTEELRKPLRPQMECVSCGTSFMSMGERPPLFCCRDCRDAFKAPEDKKPSWFMWYLRPEDRKRLLELIELHWPTEK